MTFEEWFQREAANYEGQWSFAKAAWEAGARVAREECAGICERRAAIQDIAGLSMEAECCADAIRETMK
jgi:hypothetical protein